MEFRKMRLADVATMSKWGMHTDPRFYHYNFPYKNSEEYMMWYMSKQKIMKRKVYGLFDENQMVLGFVTLKEINWVSKEATLGIAIDPGKVSQGFGKILLNEYLKYVFFNFPIAKIRLRVATFNKRAQHTYEKCGFYPVEIVTEVFEEQEFKDEIMERFSKDFHIDDGILYTEFLLMEITKERFLNRSNK